jgi:TolB-like protein
LDKGQESLAAVERLVAADPSREDWHRLALRLHAKFAGQDAALARARALAGVLRRDYDLEPDSKTVALVEGIRAGKIARAEALLVDRAVVPKRAAPEDVRAAPVPEKRGHLQRPMLPASARGPLARFRLPTAATAAIAVLAILVAMLPHLVASPSKVGSNQPASGEFWRPTPRGQGPTARITAFLVLPFKTHDAESGDTQILADIMTDDVITTLSRVPGFRVIARETTRTFKQHPVNIAAIGAELRVHYILDGSLRVRDGGLRVNLKLIDPATRLSVWTHRVDRDVTDRGGALDEIVGRICRELQSEMLEIEIARRRPGCRYEHLSGLGRHACGARRV